MRVIFPAAAAALLALSGCGSTRPNLCQLSDTSPLVIEASDRLNPDEQGRSLPTIIRVYQLRDIGALEQASFQEVWRNPAETLGESLIAEDELTIYPEQTVRRALDRDPAANFIVGMGIFRQPVGTTWRSVLPLPAPRSESQCAAQQGEEGEAAAPPIPHATFFVENNRIEGELELEPASSGSSCAAGDPFCAAAQQAGESAPEAPEAPAAPEAPSAPAAPGPKSWARERTASSERAR